MTQFLMRICQTMCGLNTLLWWKLKEIPCLDGNVKPLMHVLDHWFFGLPFLSINLKILGKE